MLLVDIHKSIWILVILAGNLTATNGVREMIVFLGFVFQLVIGLFLLLLGWASATNMGFSETSGIDKLVGVVIICIGVYLLYDLSTMFSFNGVNNEL